MTDRESTFKLHPPCTPFLHSTCFGAVDIKFIIHAIANVNGSTLLLSYFVTCHFINGAHWFLPFDSGRIYWILKYMHLQWRRQEFFGGERPGDLKAIKRYPQRIGGGGEGPPTVPKFHFLKRFKVFENVFIFQKCQHFSSPKDPFFLRKIEHILQEFLNFFEKIILNFHLL